MNKYSNNEKMEIQNNEVVKKIRKNSSNTRTKNQMV